MSERLPFGWSVLVSTVSAQQPWSSRQPVICGGGLERLRGPFLSHQSAPPSPAPNKRGDTHEVGEGLSPATAVAGEPAREMLHFKYFLQHFLMASWANSCLSAVPCPAYVARAKGAAGAWEEPPTVLHLQCVTSLLHSSSPKPVKRGDYSPTSLRQGSTNEHL